MTTTLEAELGPDAGDGGPDTALDAGPTGESPVRGAIRAVAGAGLVAFIIAAANAVLLSRSHLVDVRLPMLGLGIVLSSPGWLLLILAARLRGAPGRWLAVAAAWGFFAAPLLAFIAEDLLAPVMAAIYTALAPLGRDIAEVGPGAIIAPIVEEPAKALGVLIVLIAIRRTGTALTLGLGAAVGGLAGLGFSLTEISHRIGEVVANSGHVDLNGMFVIDWDAVWRIELLQLVNRLYVFGLSDHVIFTALAGVAIVLLGRRRWAAAGGLFLAALIGHALVNSIGVRLGEGVLGALGVTGVRLTGVLPTLGAVWLASFFSFLVAQGGAVLLLRKVTRR